MPYLDKLCPSVNLAALIRGVRRRRRALSLLRCITSFGAGSALCCVYRDSVCSHPCVQQLSIDESREVLLRVAAPNPPSIALIGVKHTEGRHSCHSSHFGCQSCHFLEASRVNSKRQAGLKGNTGGLRTSRPSWSRGKETIDIRDMRIVDQTHIALFREHGFSRIFSFIICQVNTWERRHFLMRSVLSRASSSGEGARCGPFEHEDCTTIKNKKYMFGILTSVGRHLYWMVLNTPKHNTWLELSSCCPRTICSRGETGPMWTL